MINFIQTHPIVIFSIGLILIFVLLLAIIKVSKSDTKETQKPEITKSVEQDPEKPDVAETVNQEDKTEKEQEDKEENQEEDNDKKKDKKEKKEKKEKKVEKVFESKQKPENPEAKQKAEEKDENELLEKMAFVKTSKTISKLAKKEWIEKVPESEFTTEELIAIDNLIRERELEDESKKSVHFDKSIRLSNITKNGDYYAMFGSHISETKKHLSSRKIPRIDKNLMDKLYARTYRTLEMSGYGSKDDIDLEDGIEELNLDPIADQAADQREELAYMIDASYYADSNMHSDEPDSSLNLGPENMLVVDTVMHRKNKSNPPKRH